MSMPTYQQAMLPLLRLSASGDEIRVASATDQIADTFDLTEDERSLLIPSGRSPLIRNRVGWARTYLKQAGLLEQTRRGHIRITDAGRAFTRSSTAIRSSTHARRAPRERPVSTGFPGAQADRNSSRSTPATDN